MPHPRLLACTALALLAAAASAPAYSADLTVPRLAGAVTLDGRLQEPQWRQAAVLRDDVFSRWVADNYRQDPSAFALRLFHDGRNLYVALSSYDRFVEPDAQPENSDGLYSFSVVTRAGGVQHYRLRWSASPPAPGGEMAAPGKWGARLRGPFADPTRAGGGYVFEFAVPLSAIGRRAGDTVPINVIVLDHDGKPYARYNDAGVEFARFAFGSLDNENRAAYRKIRLAP